MRLSQPWPEGYTVNARSPYGWRKHPITGKRSFHRGVDVAGVFPVTAAGDGVVRHIGWSPRGGGHVVGIEHGTNLWTFYYHGRERTALRNAQRVRAGDFIYTSGNTGASTGNHLHFEVRKSRRWGDTVDPMPYLQAEETPEPVKPEPVEISKPLPPGVPINKPEPAKPNRIPTPLSPKLQAFFNMKRGLKSHD